MSDLIDMDQVKRLGFEVWADNLIMNCVAVAPWGGITQMTYEKQGATVIANFYEKSTQYVVRAYIPGEGFKYHERIIKL